MKAIAVKPGVEDSAHLIEMPKPKVSDVANGNGVLVRVLRVGGCGTDREINDAEYGTAPEGSEVLVIGHEAIGIVEDTGPNVKNLKLGDHVVATVRRPGTSIYDKIGMNDFTTDETYFERGISRLHGFMAEYYVEDAEFIVKVPAELRDVGVLLEPMAVVVKGIAQAFEIQRRLRIWEPKRAAVLGVGTIGLLAVMLMRLRGIDVVAFGKEPGPYFNSDLAEAAGAVYESTAAITVHEYAKQHGAFDMIFEATGYSPIVLDAMQAVAKNGVLIMSSVTGGDRTAEAPIDKINQEFVLGNKVAFGTVNANREYFESGVKEMALATVEYPGWLEQMLTHKISGIDNFRELFDTLGNGKNVVKAFLEISTENGRKSGNA